MTAVVSSPPAVLAAVVAETSFRLMNDSTRSNLLLFVVAVQEALAVANSGRFFCPPMVAVIFDEKGPYVVTATTTVGKIAT